MDAVNADFVHSAELANEAGFDLLELHFAHGYLLSSFISPLTNRRTDEYGGSIDSRMRYPARGVRRRARRSGRRTKPMSVRSSARRTGRPGGIDARGRDSTSTVLLKQHGGDVIDVSAGQTVPDAKPVYGRLFQTPFSELVRHEAGIATMTVGNISSYSDVNSIIAAGRADLCVLARAHLYDPYWTRHAATEPGSTSTGPISTSASRATRRVSASGRARAGRPLPSPRSRSCSGARRKAAPRSGSRLRRCARTCRKFR